MTDTPKPSTIRLMTEEASNYLRVTHGVRRAPNYLAKLRVVGGGPTFAKFGRHVLYTPGALDAWVQQQLSAPLHSTSDGA